MLVRLTTLGFTLNPGVNMIAEGPRPISKSGYCHFLMKHNGPMPLVSESMFCF